MRARRGFPLASVWPCVAAFRCGFHPCALFHPSLHFPRRKARPKQKNFSPFGRSHSARRRYLRRINFSLNPGAWRDSQARRQQATTIPA